MALRVTAERIQSGAEFRWTHMGACNCGHLAQTVTRLSAAELRRIALEKRGDWAEQALEHCPSSGYPIDHVIETLLGLGLTRQDLAHLERLSDATVLRRLPAELRTRLSFRERDHVVAYLTAWSEYLAERLPKSRAAA